MKRDPSVPRPPVGARRYRRWRVFYEHGHSDSQRTLETGWYAKGPGGDIIQSSDWNDVFHAIDEIENALGHPPTDQPPPLIAHNPPRQPGPYSFWRPWTPIDPQAPAAATGETE